MNERIRELWSKAGGHYDTGNQHTWPQYTIDDPKKFAELIVKECIEHLESSVAVPNLEHSRTKTKCIRSIKEHFGVE
jgi:hypothetical protein